MIIDCPIIGIQFIDNQNISEGLKIACLFRTIAISFNTNSCWDAASLDLIHISEDENQNIFEQIVSVNHASKTSHIDLQKEWLGYLLSKGLIASNWRPSLNYFPNLEFSNQLMENSDWDLFIKKRDSAHSSHERLAIIIDIGQRVAERNSYTKDKKISELNSSKTIKRIIFGAGRGKFKTYLSLDLEKGGFEVCNYLGEHQGEYFFDGSKKSESRKDHNIKVKS